MCPNNNLRDESVPSKGDEWEDELEPVDDNPGELRVPKGLVGRIIGKRGCKIKEIREASGARIDVSLI